MNIIEIEYQELNSTPYKNYRYGIKIKTNDKDYENDFINMIAEVKTKLHNIIELSKPKKVKSEKREAAL